MRPNIITPTKPKIPEVNEINLSDNNKIYTFHTTRTDLVSILIIPLGYKFANNPVIGKFAWEMIKSGTKQNCNPNCRKINY